MEQDSATPEEVAVAIAERAREIAEEEVAKLIEQRIVPLEKKVAALEGKQG
jgi:hypothetical protein